MNEFNRHQPNPQKRGVTLGHDVWIAKGVSVMRGITIGDGPIIAADSVVTKDVPPYAVVGGNPAGLLRYRFDEETVSQWLTLRWWQFSISKFKHEDLISIAASIDAARRLDPAADGLKTTMIAMADMPGERI